MAAPTTVHASGQIVATGLPLQNTGHVQNLEGGLINHAVAKTAASIHAQAAHAKAGGVTMRGSGRKRGGADAHVPIVPEGGTIPGVSFAGNHANLLNIHNQLNSGKVYDGLTNTQPYKVSGGKRRSKTKRHGRIRHNRHSHRNNRKRTRRSRRHNKHNKR